MANPLSKRLPSQVTLADLETYRAFKAIPDYKPANTDYSFDVVSALFNKLQAALDAELHTQNTYAAARDAAVAIQHEFHAAILGVKNQFKAQYGVDSDQVAALGLKKKSERKSRARAGKAEEATAT
ncbi:MAG: hypothetical protein JSS57_02875 [Proteobacteria bacterium]|nr:hypothetical protein [Pseudomonadota bacterium]